MTLWIRLIAIACAVALLGSCASSRKHSAAEVSRVGDQSRFFAMNAITPYHHWVGGGEARAQAVSEMQINLDRAKKLGASSVRVDMWWHVIEPERGVWDWELTDQVVASMVEREIEPYPILCYHSAWSENSTSPATPDERTAFANYAGNIAKRYADDLYYYEVWNEPNISPFWNPAPNAKDYALLLKSTYEAVKEADPDSMVVAMCTAGPDYSFIESVYREGAADYCDAISWHHYSNHFNESEMEHEIEKIREIMGRYGDGDKPLLLTESGLSTGPGPVLREVTQEEQASWIVKKHLLAKARGVHQFYHFKLQDDRSETNPDGYWGLVTHDRKDKLSAWTYGAMTTLLKEAEFLGFASNTVAEPGREGDAEVQVYRLPGGEIAAAAWVRGDGDDLTIRLPSETTLRVENIVGGFVENAPTTGKHAMIRLARDPLYIRDLGPPGERLVGVTFDPPVVNLLPGRSRPVTVEVRNPAGDPLKLDLSSLTNTPEGSGISVNGLPSTLEVPAGKTVRHSFNISLASHAEPFRLARLRRNQDGNVVWGLDIRYQEPFSVDIRGNGSTGNVELTAEVRNNLREPLAGTVSWRINGIAESVESDFGPLSSTRVFDNETFSFPPNEGENVVTCVAFDDEGGQGTKTYRVYGQEMVEEPPVIDGQFGDWNDPPVVRMRLSKQDSEQKRHIPFASDEDFKGDIRVLWTNTHLYVGADVTDSTPLLNPYEGTDVWKGDSLELYIGFPGPTNMTAYPPGYHQVVISPGNDGRDGFAWNFRALDREALPDGHRIPGSEVAASRTDNGYILEAAIPLEEFGVTAREGQVVAFDMHLNNRFSHASGSNDAVLIWNGDRDNWRDPTDWGAAVILPDPSKRPRTSRGQLHGGETTLIISPDATKDVAYKTPLPVEKSEYATNLPDWLELSLPFRGSHDVATGYGFESDSWTHQTIGNTRSANDFYCIDVNMPEGTPILAAAPGRIAQSNRRGDSYGHYVVIDHGGGYQSIYAHLSSREFDVDLGEPMTQVERGQVIGHSGQSGTSWPHLHFGLHKDARASHSGANVGGKTVCPEPLGGYYGIRKGHVLSSN